jgi:hypothetical protein
LIPSFTLFSIGTLITLGVLAPSISEVWGGSLVLGGIALSFLVIYLVDTNNWWAIIPAGVLFTLSLVAGLDAFFSFETGGIFFLGLGLTFALVAVAPNPQGSTRWAWIPASILGLMGLLILAAAGEMVGLLLPVVLILAGGYLLLRTLRPAER